MDLTEELRAALPGWLVTGGAVSALATHASTAITVQVESYGESGLVAHVYRGSLPISAGVGATVPELLDSVRATIRRGLRLLAEQTVHGKAALDALGGGR